MKKDFWKQLIQVVITILTAIATSLGMASCRADRHRNLVDVRGEKSLISHWETLGMGQRNVAFLPAIPKSSMSTCSYQGMLEGALTRCPKKGAALDVGELYTKKIRKLFLTS